MSPRRDSWDGSVYRRSSPPAPPEIRRVDHRLHLVLTIVTGGAWGVLVWWWQPPWARGQHRQAMLMYASDVLVWNSVQGTRAAREKSAAIAAAMAAPPQPKCDRDETVELPVVQPRSGPR